LHLTRAEEWANHALHFNCLIIKFICYRYDPGDKFSDHRDKGVRALNHADELGFLCKDHVYVQMN